MERIEINGSDRAAQMAALPEQGERLYGVVGERGLFLRAKSTGSKSWLFRQKLNGKVIKKGLGAFPDVRFQTAAQEASELRGDIRRGIDPRAAQAAAQAAATAAKTFSEVCAAYLEDRSDLTFQAHRRIEAYVRDYVDGQSLGRKAISELERSDLLPIVRGVEKQYPAKAQAMGATFSAILRFAVDEGWLSKSSMIDATAQLPRPHYQSKAAKADRARQRGARHLEEGEFVAIWQTAADWRRANEPAVQLFGGYIQMLALTGGRRSEIRWLRRSEINGVIRFPFTKNGTDHHVYVTPQMTAVLDAMPRDHDLVFSLGNRALKFEGEVFDEPRIVPMGSFGPRMDRFRSAVDERMGRQIDASDQWSLHSLRKWSSTTMAKLGVQEHIRRLAHNQKASRAVMTEVYEQPGLYEDQIAEAFIASNARMAEIVEAK